MIFLNFIIGELVKFKVYEKRFRNLDSYKLLSNLVLNIVVFLYNFFMFVISFWYIILCCEVCYKYNNLWCVFIY